jgi:hypothetical protein
MHMKYVGILSLLLMTCAAGCDSGPRLLRVFGNVSFAGKPIEKGTIEFVPIDGTPGPSTGGSIADGHYEVAALQGPREGGIYQVRITAMKKTGKTIPNIFKPGGPPLELEDNFIPPKYNRNSTLKITVTAEAATQGIDFSLP